MENQPIEQTTMGTPGQASTPTVGQTVQQSSPSTIWYIVLAVAAIALGVAYFATESSDIDEVSTDAQATTVQTETPALTDGNTTSDIFTDLNLTPDSSAALDADAAASASALQGL